MVYAKTVRSAHSIHGVDPQHLVEKIVRERIYESAFFREKCDTLDFQKVLMLSTKLDHIGGTFSNTKPVPFICLVLKLLQIQPSEECLSKLFDSSCKYSVALGLFYYRMIFDAKDCYEKIEKYYVDYRKLKVRNADGTFSIIYMDEFADNLLTCDRVFGIVLPRISKREFLEDRNELSVRKPLIDFN